MGRPVSLAALVAALVPLARKLSPSNALQCTSPKEVWTECYRSTRTVSSKRVNNDFGPISPGPRMDTVMTLLICRLFINSSYLTCCSTAVCPRTKFTLNTSLLPPEGLTHTLASFLASRSALTWVRSLQVYRPLDHGYLHLMTLGLPPTATATVLTGTSANLCLRAVSSEQ